MSDSAEQDRLTRYLLGLLPQAESERLDELSVTSDDFAAELDAAENELVDAYARGELPAEFAAPFESVYSSSERRRQKRMLAEAFNSYFETTRRAFRNVGAANESETPKRSWFSWAKPQWAFAAATALLLVSGYLGVANQSLRRRLDQSEVARAQLEKEGAQPEPAKGATAPNSLSGGLTDHLRVASFVLLPPLRGSGPLARVVVPADSDLIVLKLELEPTEFPTYRVTLEDVANRNVIWKSDDLKPVPEHDRQAVSFALKPSLLESKNYILELSGVRKNGQAELVSAYPFKSTVQ